MHPPPVPGFSNTLYQGRWYEVGTMNVGHQYLQLLKHTLKGQLIRDKYIECSEHQYLWLLQHTLPGKVARSRYNTSSKAYFSTSSSSSTLYQDTWYEVGTRLKHTSVTVACPVHFQGRWYGVDISREIVKTVPLSAYPFICIKTYRCAGYADHAKYGYPH